MGLEIYAAIGAVIAAIAAYFAGSFRAKTKANADARIAETKRVAESNVKAADAQVTAVNNANKVNDEILIMPTGAAADELLRDYARDGNKGN